MSYRVGGALALIAAVLLAISIASHGWWSGHPVVEGHEHAMQDISIGLLGGEGCNTAGDGSCKKILLGGGFKTLSAIELAVGLATLLLALALAATTFLEKTQRRRLATVVLIAGGPTTVLALILALTGPDMIKAPSGTTVPIGISAFLGIVGGLMATASGWVSRRPARVRSPIAQAPFPIEPWMSPAPAPPPPRAMPTPPAPRPQLPDPITAPPPAPPQQPPPQPQPPPPKARPEAVSPGGKLSGPSGPLAPPSSAHPPYVAGGLRPLYELPGQAMQPVAPQIAMPATPPVRARPIPRRESEDSLIEPPPPAPPPPPPQLPRKPMTQPPQAQVPRTIAGMPAKPLTAPPPFAARALPPITRPPPLRMPVPQGVAISATAPTISAPPLAPLVPPPLVPPPDHDEDSLRETAMRAKEPEPEVGDSTDANVQAVGEGTAQTQSAPEDSVDIETTAHERVSAGQLETVPLERPSNLRDGVDAASAAVDPRGLGRGARREHRAVGVAVAVGIGIGVRDRVCRCPHRRRSPTRTSRRRSRSRWARTMRARPKPRRKPRAKLRTRRPPTRAARAQKSAPAIPAGPISSTAPATLPPPQISTPRSRRTARRRRARNAIRR